MLEEHNEDSHFFMRVEWEKDNFKLNDAEVFLKEFEPLRKEFDMELSLDF
jgi:formyltetrahydrofolate hydrolase